MSTKHPAISRAEAAVHTSTQARDLIHHAYTFEDADQREAALPALFNGRIALPPATAAANTLAYGPISRQMEQVEQADRENRPVLAPSAWARALARARAQGIHAIRIGHDQWVATSAQTGEYDYDVKRWAPSSQALSCTCAAGQEARFICKHMAIVWDELEAEMSRLLSPAVAEDIAF